MWEKKEKQERAKKIEIWTEWKRELGNNKFKKLNNINILPHSS
jgi:hypothetical protein